MANVILTTRSMFPSARAIRDSLEELTGRRIFLTEAPKRNHRVILRWGSSLKVADDADLINCENVVATCANKGLFSSLLDGSDIPHPSFFRREPAAGEFPILVRTTLTGFGGAGIIPCRNLDEWRAYANHYWTHYEPLQSEFRVHVAGGTILKVFRKIAANEEAEQDEFKIRNLHRGYRFSLVDFSGKRKMVDFITNLWEKLGFGNGVCAFDIGWMSRGEYFVLEGNSAPGLSENDDTLRKYVEYFTSYVEKRL